jgi:magnesium chelatase accessory protein
VPRAIFSPLARLLAATPLIPQLFAWRARDRAAVERLIASTGSRLDARGIDAYAQIVADPAHVSAALAMMANWDLAALERDLNRLRTPTLLIAGANDRTLPASESRRARDVLPTAEFVELPGLGHLAHEEAPAQVARLILDFAARLGR